MRFRVLTTLAALAAVIGILAVGAGSATGTVVQYKYNPLADPQTTNVPWLAWAGETVKVSRCFGIGDSQITSDNYATYAGQKGFDPLSLLQGRFSKADWSGATDQPPFFQTGSGDETSTTVSPTWYDGKGGGVCFSTDVTSLKAGLEDIDFSINTDLGQWLNELLGQDIIFQQDLLVIWMWDSNPVLSESSDLGAYTVGDPGGSGNFSPIADANGVKHLYPGLINVQVQGTFPLGNDYAGLNMPTVTLPNDWVWLADHFAVDYSTTSTYLGSAPNRWDIHDDDLATEGHVAASLCDPPYGTVEAVDNCYGSDPENSDADLGPFSSIFGPVGTYNDAIGPFDPVRSYETLLSDGNLNANDAPMPALRVDVSLTNAGADHAVGYLSKADKSLIYNRLDPQYGGAGDNTSLSAPHVLYAPFYKALIPAVTPLADFNTTSGVEGSINGNEPNWLTWILPQGVTTSQDEQGIYDYWDTYSLGNEGGYNSCFGADGQGISRQDNVDTDGTGTSVAVYTDEHGQAMVQFNPANPDGEGINLTSDGNGRCDVYTGSLTGTATIQAESVYPAKQPSDPSNMGTPKLSNTLTKTVTFTPSKTLTCIKKGVNEAYCVETVTDFEGNPIKANVEFTTRPSAPGAIGPDNNPFGGFDPTGQNLWADSTNQIVTGWTSPITGEAAIYVQDSINECVDVHVENLGTRNGGQGIFRDFDFNPYLGTTCGTNTGTGPISDGGSGGGSTPSNPGPTGGSGAQAATVTPVAVTSPAPTAAPTAAVPAKTAKTAKTAKMTLVSARVIAGKNGRFLNVRVNSVAKMARLRITLVNKNGKHAVIFRYVHTNKMVRVANLKLGATVKTVQVAVA